LYLLPQIPFGKGIAIQKNRIAERNPIQKIESDSECDSDRIQEFENSIPFLKIFLN